MDKIINLISSVGFPIVCVLCLGWFVYQLIKSNNEQTAKRDEQHASEVKELRDTLTKNTEVLANLNTTITVLLEHMKEGDPDV